MRAGLWLTGAIVLLLAAMAVKNMLIALPDPPVTAGDGFDANRAAERLQRILGDERPHPADSANGDAVRERLIAEMRSVGLNPRVTDDFACNSFARNRSVSCARVRNLVATIGPEQGRHLLLVAHYDSTFVGPGAGDDGIGVATLLETASLLRGQTLTRPVTFLLNEGEEMGLLGARAFMDHDPLRERVDTLINLEARGVTGPAVMFETSRPNAAAIALYQASSPRPVANSLTTDLYGLIPNSTDVTVFNAAPWTILNFAIIGNETRYHSAGDNLAALDRRSLQHMGEQTLAAARLVAAGEAPAAEGHWFYADLIGLTMVSVPMLVALALLGLVLVFMLSVTVKRRAYGLPLLAMVLSLVGATAFAWLGQTCVGLLRDGDYWRAWPLVATTATYASAIAAILIALRFVARDAEPARLRPAFWVLYTLLGAALSVVAPGGSIFFIGPPLLAGLGMLAARWNPIAERIGALLALLLLYLTFGVALGLFEELMNGGPQWMFAPLGALVLLPALIELRSLVADIRPVLLWAVAGDLVLLGWGAVALTPAYSADRQQQFGIEYVWDADAHSGRWAVNNDGAPVPYEANWERAELPYSTRRRWVTEAPAAAVTPPVLEPVSVEPFRQSWMRMRVRLRMNGAQSITLIIPAEASLWGAGVPYSLRQFGAGRPDERYFLRCVGRACDGAEFDIVFSGNNLPGFTLIGTRPGLPTAAAPLLQARPETARPQYGADSTITVSQSRPGFRSVVSPIRPAP